MRAHVAVGAAIFATAICAQTAYGQSYQHTPAYYQDRYEQAVKAMQAAIDKCDRAGYDNSRRDYDFYKKAAVGPFARPAPDYPEPCSRRLRTTNIRAQPEPIKRYSVGTLYTRPPEQGQQILFNVGLMGGLTSNQSSIEDFSLKGSGGVVGATFGMRWTGVNNGFVGVQGNVFFPFVTQSTNFASGPTVKLQTLFTQDFQVGFKLADSDAVRPAERIFLPADFYASIGVAEGRVEANFAPFSDTKTLVGPTIAVGADVIVAPNIVFFAEGRYFNLFDQKFSLSGAGPITPVPQRGFMVTGGVKIPFDVTSIPFVSTLPPVPPLVR
jgi:opacity protein-like surface antigen